jgi:hypothetical protein
MIEVTKNPASPTAPGWGVGKKFANYAKNIITDWETAVEPQAMNVADNNGAVCERVIYDEKTTVNATILVQDGFTLPKATDTLTVDGASFYVTNVREVQSNKDFRKVVLTLERHKNYPTGAGK